MFTRPLLAALAVTGSLVLAGCASREARFSQEGPVVATLGEADGVIVLRPGQALYVNLYLQEGTGLAWRIEHADQLRPVGYQGRFVGRGGRPLPAVVRRAEVVQQFLFRAETPGEGELLFTLGPARGQGAEPEQVAAYHVQVR